MKTSKANAATTPKDRESGMYAKADPATAAETSGVDWKDYKNAENTVLRGKANWDTFDIESQMALPQLIQRVLHGRTKRGDVAVAALMAIAHEVDEINWKFTCGFPDEEDEINAREYVQNRLGDLKNRALAAVELHERIRDGWAPLDPKGGA
jgi:hypothetical protein